MVAPSSSPADEVIGELIHGVRVSSVGPGRMMGQGGAHDPSAMDLAMKLHYLRPVYFFRGGAGGSALPGGLKESLFTWLNLFHVACGRFRRSDTGRPFIKCNDCGVRFIEARSAKTLDEWLEMPDRSLDRLLVPNQVIGPELMFSPLVLIQITSFGCGGVSVGLSWAHVLGDAYSACHFIDVLGQIMSGTYQPSNGPDHRLLKSHSIVDESPNPKPLPSSIKPLSLKQVDPVGDHWVPTNGRKMETLTFYVGPEQLTKLQSIISGPNKKGPGPPIFESLCAVIWQCVARIRRCEQEEPKTVTLCKADDTRSAGKKKGVICNSQRIMRATSDVPVSSANPGDLAALLVDRVVDERGDIEAAVEAGGGLSDFIVYGANLTFLDLQEPSIFYDFELKGEKPIYLSYAVDGVGDSGVVSVLPGPPKKDSSSSNGGGRDVTLKFPKGEGLKVKEELENLKQLLL